MYCCLWYVCKTHAMIFTFICFCLPFIYIGTRLWLCCGRAWLWIDGYALLCECPFRNNSHCMTQYVCLCVRSHKGVLCYSVWIGYLAFIVNNMRYIRMLYKRVCRISISLPTHMVTVSANYRKWYYLWMNWSYWFYIWILYCVVPAVQMLFWMDLKIGL